MTFPWTKLIVPAAIFLAGFASAWTWMDSRVTVAKTATAVAREGIRNRDDTIALLQGANGKLSESVASQNASIQETVRVERERQDKAQAALAAARRSNDATLKTIDALAARIVAGTGDCSKAIADIKGGL